MASAVITTLGLNHYSAPVEVRERLAFGPDDLKPSLEALRSAFPGKVGEAALLSTCNRTELYCAVHPEAAGHLPLWLANIRGVAAKELSSHLYQHEHQLAVRHAFRVASGLDSMVLGEPQILGQMKDAVRQAEEAGSVGTLLHQLFQRTFATAKDVRSKTAIGEQSVSMAAAAVKLAERIFGDLGDSQVLFIGAGEMIDLCATHFAAHRPKHMVIANRTMARGETLAARVGAEAITLAEMPLRLHQFDVVVSCTASTLPIIGLGLVERVCKARRHRPIVMVDLAVPRDIESDVDQLDDVYLYTVDDLGAVVQSATESRKAAIVQAEAIIDERVGDFLHWLDSRSTVPLIKDLQAGADAVRELELDRARKALAAGADPAQVLEQLAHQLTRKFLHPPLTALQQASAGEREQLRDWLPRLYPNSRSDRRS